MARPLRINLDNFVSLSSDGRTVGIGAYQHDGNVTNAGHARVFSLFPH